jgi:GntR family transcriptional regulator
MLHVTISQGDGIPLYLQLVQQISRQIATGRLAPHAELPPVRVLAQQLVVNPNTVVRAYRELETAKLIYKKRGAGTYVADAATPFTDEECRRILGERADALLVESRNLGYDLEQTIALLRDRDAAFEQDVQDRKGA